MLLAASKYNRSVHSVIGHRPIDVIHSIPQQLREDIINRITRAQALELERLNRCRKLKTYQPGDKVFVKTNKRIGNKLTKLYLENTVERDLGTTVLINGRRVHKANLRCLLLVVVAWSQAKLFNYTNSHFVLISTGKVAVHDQYEILIHRTNLTNYEAIASDTERLVAQYPISPAKNLLQADADQILALLETLKTHHRHSRGINILGTALKYIAGTPDFDDFNEVATKERELIEANEQQIIVNTQLQTRINNLTRAMNDLLKTTKETVADTGHLFGLATARNRELTNIVQSVTLGRHNIINPIILDNEDTKTLLFTERFANVTISDILVASKLRILQDSDNIFFIIKYPKICKICKQVRLLPVVHDRKIVQLETEIAAHCDSEYQPLTGCKNTTNLTFCQPLASASCVEQLLNHNSAHCKTTSADHIAAVEEIDDGLIVVNDQLVEVTEGTGSGVTVRGTFLIMFEGNVTINDTNFVNWKKVVSSREIPPATTIMFTDHTRTLSLTYLEEIHARNLKHIASLQQEITTKHLISITSLGVVATVILIILMIYLWSKRQRKLAIIEVIRNTDTSTPSDM